MPLPSAPKHPNVIWLIFAFLGFIEIILGTVALQTTGSAQIILIASATIFAMLLACAFILIVFTRPWALYGPRDFAPGEFSILLNSGGLSSKVKDNAPAQAVATLAVLKEWDQRTGSSRLWLIRHNPEWASAGKAVVPMKLTDLSPTSDDGESYFHANIVLNFMDDIALAIEKGLIYDEVLRSELVPSFLLWWKRTKPLRDLIKRDGRSPGWDRVRRLLGESEEHFEQAESAP